MIFESCDHTSHSLFNASVFVDLLTFCFSSFHSVEFAGFGFVWGVAAGLGVGTGAANCEDVDGLEDTCAGDGEDVDTDLSNLSIAS